MSNFMRFHVHTIKGLNHLELHNQEIMPFQFLLVRPINISINLKTDFQYFAMHL